jgi:signal transduction histidine kinase
MTATDQLPDSVSVLTQPELRSLLAALPAALIDVAGPDAATLAPTSLAALLGDPTGEPVPLDRLVEPAHVAQAIALLAQVEPMPVPTSTRLGLTRADAGGTLDVLATCRRLASDDAGSRSLLALVPAPGPDSDDETLLAREALLEEAERVARLGSWDWDIAEDKVTWSDEMYRIYGAEPGEYDVTLSVVLEHTVPEDRDYTRSVIEHGLATQLPFTYAHHIRRPDGQVRVLHSRGVVTETDEAGHPLHLVGACQDVTTQHDLQELGRQFRELYERERHVAGQLREVDSLKDALVAAVSHDLRTPLTVIVGSATTLRDHGARLDAATRRALLDNLIEHASRLHEMLSDLLDLDRLRRDDIRPSRQPTALRALVQRLLDRDGLGRFVMLDMEGPDVIAEVDAAKVERIVDNLVRNARRHTPTGTHVWVRVEADGDDAVISVEDDGPGVPQIAQRRIFEPFERGATTNTAIAGSGLGLAIVSRFAQLHGGSATVGERDGGGAAFHVRLPLRGR